jgi:hypothetical protein
MNGVSTIQAAMNMPAIAVLRLSRENPVQANRNDDAEEALLAAVTHPPRIGETRPIAALMPELLARYGIAGEATGGETMRPCINVLA